MLKPWQVITELETDNSRLFKESVVGREAAAGNTEFFEGCKLALDSMITFGVKQVPERTGADGPGVDWDSFTLILTGFVNRTFTGNLAKETLAELMSNCTNDQWNNWYRRIFIKDLRCGVSEKTINKMVEKKYANYRIPVFSCQLAHDSANHETKVVGRKHIEVKLDGVRVITIAYPDGRVDQFSRNGKELVNFPHIKEQLSEAAKAMSFPWVLDGEVMSASFQDLMKQIHRKGDVKSNDAVLHLFDWLPLEDFLKGGWHTTQKERSKALKLWHGYYADKLPNVSTVGYEDVDLDTDKGKKRYKEINEAAIAGGYEGIMLKDPEAPYEVKRTVSWLKLKPFIEVSLTAVAVEEGTGKNVGKMGAVVFEGTDDGKFIRVSVGGGWSDQDREDIWANKALVLGEIGEVRADAATLNQDSDNVYSLRFPRFKSWRGFVPGEKL